MAVLAVCMLFAWWFFDRCYSYWWFVIGACIVTAIAFLFYRKNNKREVRDV